MILLRSDCLVFELGNGEKIPCSAATVTVELLGSAVQAVDREVVEHAAAAVLHYFRHELHRNEVTISEFSQALETALRGLGLQVTCETTQAKPRPAVADLGVLAVESGRVFELGFFHRLREQVRTDLQRSPQLLRFTNLRGCVKQLSGAKRWSPRCQQLNDQIVDYLRNCVSQESPAQPCGLLVV